jgi:type IV fimbrial biogenesis protein FimT
MTRRIHNGFTLLELMSTVLLASILLGIGIPNLLQFVRNNRMAAATNDLVGAIHLARSEAITRRSSVTLCASPNPVAVSPACSPDASGTNGGYIVWVDGDADAVVDGSEQILLQMAEASGISLLGDNGFIHFNREGFIDDVPSEGDSATLVLLCDARGNVITTGATSAARAVRIPPTGRPLLLSGVDEISATGTECP